MSNIKDVFEEELIYGAREEAAMWKRIAFVTSGFGVAGCLAAAMVALFIDKPPPALVPFDPTTGAALPMANVGTISLAEREAVGARGRGRGGRDGLRLGEGGGGCLGRE